MTLAGSLFTPFQRLHRARTRAERAWNRTVQASEKHSGRIWASRESGPARGLLFPEKSRQRRRLVANIKRMARIGLTDKLARGVLRPVLSGVGEHGFRPIPAEVPRPRLMTRIDTFVCGQR